MRDLVDLLRIIGSRDGDGDGGVSTWDGPRSEDREEIYGSVLGFGQAGKYELDVTIYQGNWD